MNVENRLQETIKGLKTLHKRRKSDMDMGLSKSQKSERGWDQEADYVDPCSIVA